jgi:hypothetical protein
LQADRLSLTIGSVVLADMVVLLEFLMLDLTSLLAENMGSLAICIREPRLGFVAKNSAADFAKLQQQQYACSDSRQ